MQTPAELVRAARETAQMSASALSRRAGVSTTTVTRVERGEVDPTVGMLGRLLAAAGSRLDLVTRPADDQPELARLTRAWTPGPAGDLPDWTAIRAVLDVLQRRPELVPTAIFRPPQLSGSRVLDALLAGLADKLADDADVARPPWTSRGRRLRQSWEPAGTPRQTAHRRARTPPQLAARNLVIDVETLWRRTSDA